MQDNFKRRRIRMKNISEIKKIIKELAIKDCIAAKSVGKERPYSLSVQTKEAVEIRDKYLYGQITEEEYKEWCVKYNFTH